MNGSFYGFGPADEEARSFRPGGLLGARAASRLAGATSSGAPTAGAFRKGDLLIGQDGTARICTAAGTPGTWVQLGTLVDPLTTRGDIITRAASGTGRLALGSNNQVLTSNGTDAVWGASPASAGGALTQIAQTVLSSSAANITFSSIAGTYSSLRVLLLGRGDKVATDCQVRAQFNSDGGSNYDWVHTEWFNTVGWNTDGANGTTYANVGRIAAASASANMAGMLDLLLVNYAGTTFDKVYRAESEQTLSTAVNNTVIDRQSGQWRSTAALTSIKLFPDSGNFIAGTVCTLYGLS